MARRCPHDRLTRAARFHRSVALHASASRARPGGDLARRYKNLLARSPTRIPQLRSQTQAREMEMEEKKQHDGDGDGGGAAEGDIERLPADLLAHVLSLLPSFRDLSMTGGVSWRWRLAVERSLASRRRLSFAGQRTGDDTAARLVHSAINLRDLDISRSCWGCHITDDGLIKIASADCVKNLTSISLWGLAGITDKGVVHLVSRAYSLQHLNIGGTFITDESLYAVANNCINLKSIILWSCRHVTEAGLVALVNKCRRLECINVGGMRVPPESFVGLLSLSPALQIRSIPQILNAVS